MATWSGTISSAQTFGDGDTIVGNTTIDGAKVTVTSGANISFTGNYWIRVDNAGGELESIGTSGDNCVFDSDDGSPAAGDWRWIQFYDDSEGGTLQHTTFQHSEYNLTIGLPLTCEDCTFKDYTKRPFRALVSSGTVTITRPTIEGDADDDMCNTGGTLDIVQPTVDITSGTAIYAITGTVNISRMVADGNSTADHAVQSAGSAITVESSVIYGFNQGVDCTSGTLDLANCTLINGTIPIAGHGTGTVTALNCIAWDGSSDSMSALDSSSVDFDYGCYETQNNSTVTNSITSDPLFTAEGSDDYSLSAGSPCIDAGTSTGAPATDINGVTWPNDNPEMGAYSRSDFGGAQVYSTYRQRRV